MGISVLILTMNEEASLPACLQSVSWCDDVVVLDSLSTDATAEIARQAGARVFERQFTDFADQRNFALDGVPFKHDWVFHLDADERFTEDLLEECRRVTGEDRYSGFQVPSKTMLFGRWLRHAATYPVYQVRLLRVGELRFEQCGHGQRECAVKRDLGVLKEPYVHCSFACGFQRWFQKHNLYSSQEAARADEIHCAAANGDWRGLFGSDPVRRRRTLKDMAFRFPGRPLLRFVYLYVVRRGFLDGRAGLTYSILYSIYEWMIDMKINELRRRRDGLPV
jgi:glycosyltransferase involved in cell wall biosynthesis